MNADEEFLNRIRHDARSLRYEPEDVVLSRIAACVAARVAEAAPSPFDLLAVWFRPVAAALMFSLLAATTTVIVAQYQLVTPPTLAEMSVVTEDLFVGND